MAYIPAANITGANPQNMPQQQMQQQQMGPGPGMGGNMMQQQQQQMMHQQHPQQARFRSVNLQQHPNNNFGGGMPNQQFQPGMGQQYRQNMNQMGPVGMRGPQQQMGPGMAGPMGGPQSMLLSQVRSPPPMGGQVQSPNPGQSPRGPMGGMVASPHTPPHQYHGNMQGMQVQGGGDGDVNGSSHNVMMNNVMPTMNEMGMGAGNNGGPPDHSNQSMTPQDQLSEFVKTL